MTANKNSTVFLHNSNVNITSLSQSVQSDIYFIPQLIVFISFVSLSRTHIHIRCTLSYEYGRAHGSLTHTQITSHHVIIQFFLLIFRVLRLSQFYFYFHFSGVGFCECSSLAAAAALSTVYSTLSSERKSRIECRR